MKNLTRRSFLKVAAAAAAAGALTACGGGGSSSKPANSSSTSTKPTPKPEEPSKPAIGSQVETKDPNGVVWVANVTGAKTATLCGYSSTGAAPERVLTLPDKVNGYTITEIASSAFSSCKFREVTIPASIKTIGEWSFANSDNLTKVVVLGATKISAMAFYMCKNLESVSLNDAITSIGSNAFVACMALQSIKLPASLKTIGSDAFDSTGLKGKLIIPDNVTTIGDSAFSYTGIDELSLPEKVEKIGGSAFAGTSIRKVVLPSRITGIEGGTFGGCDNLEFIYIPAGVKYIDNDAFSTGVVGDVFGTPLKTVYYGGTEEAWNKIEIEKGNDKLLSAQKVYNAKPGDMPQ